ncbi:hypothetical protein KR222_007990 [Zaprionus bogoriensis]|nr:hypothetical protein KR222_007990 [Zaprionus bogoriensis]
MSKFVILGPAACDEYNPNYFKNLSINILQTKLYLDMNLTSPLYSGMRINMTFFVRKKNSVNYRSFYQYSLDVCSMLGTRKNNIFKRWFSKFFTFGNFKTQCPVAPGHYYVRNFSINQLEIPSFLYSGFYRITFKITQNIDNCRRQDFIIECYGEVEIK